MTIHDVEQRTAEWLVLRAGRVNGSDARNMLATVRTKGEEAAARRDLRTRLVLERLTGLPAEDDYQNADMKRGVELEPAAISAYEARGALVQPVGYCTHDTLMVGYSPDGFVGDDGLVEAKCPRSANHLKYLRAGVVPADYLPQLTHALFVTGRKWVDFLSYDEKFAGPLEPLRLFVVRLERDEKAIGSYELALLQFLKEVDAEVAEVSALLTKAAA